MALKLIQGTLKSWTPAKGHMAVGSSATLTRCFTVEDVAAYAKLAGDDNPVHLDAAYAAKTRFKKPIVHGMLYSSLFGTIFGASIPGAIYLSQTFKFKAPVYVGETISAKIEVTGVRTKPFHAATCSTKIVRENGEVCTEGEAVVMLPEPTSGEKKEEIKTAAAENPLR